MMILKQKLFMLQIFCSCVQYVSVTWYIFNSQGLNSSHNFVFCWRFFGLHDAVLMYSSIQFWNQTKGTLVGHRLLKPLYNIHSVQPKICFMMILKQNFFALQIFCSCIQCASVVWYIFHSQGISIRNFVFLLEVF